MAEWFGHAFKDFTKFPIWGWLLVAALLVASVILFMRSRSASKAAWTTREMAMGAMCIALSTVLSMVKLFEMPSGGSITPASMLPLMLFAYIYGPAHGLTLGALYGVLQYMLGGWFLNLVQLLVDYPVAFAMTGLTGFFANIPNVKKGLTVGVVVACIGRFIAAVIAGVAFWADGRAFGDALVYSLAYNGIYMVVECIICVALAILIGPRLAAELKKQK